MSNRTKYDKRRSRRETDSGRVRLALRRFAGWTGEGWEPYAAGRLLLFVTGVVTITTLPLLTTDRHTWQVLGVITAVITALLLISLLVPWSRMPRSSSLIFPMLMWGALAALGVFAGGLGSSYTGLFMLSFAYVGLSQPRGTSVRLAPVAVAAWIAAWGGWASPLAARLVIAVAIWLVLAELLAGLVAQQARMTDELRRAAHVDALTNLANRRDLDLRLATVRPGDALVICDLDFFKNLNDTFGHAAGDRVLADFGAVLRSCLRFNDYAARYGGEEFALLLPATSERQAISMLERLHSSWALLRPQITFSAGVACCVGDRSPVDTLAAADRALYAAKAGGRNRDHADQRSALDTVFPG
ncbi:MAG: putative Diguanylate cyclase [Frankiales bacterium]|nr:putative Diguanylate cyclase [Frankiales bacterium]